MTRRGPVSTDVPNTAHSSIAETDDFSLELVKQRNIFESVTAASDESKRKSYFGLGSTTPSFFHRRNTATAIAQPDIPAAAHIIALATEDNIGCIIGAGNTKVERQRNILGISYLISKRNLRKDVDACATELVAVPELAAVAPSSGKSIQGARRERYLSLYMRRPSACSSSGESSDGDSDVTLVTKDAADVDVIAADISVAQPASTDAIPEGENAGNHSCNKMGFYIGSTAQEAPNAQLLVPPSNAAWMLLPSPRRLHAGSASGVMSLATMCGGMPMSRPLLLSSPSLAGAEEEQVLLRSGSVTTLTADTDVSNSGATARSPSQPQRRLLNVGRKRIAEGSPEQEQKMMHPAANRLSFLSLGIGHRHPMNKGDHRNSSSSSCKGSLSLGRVALAPSQMKEIEQRKMDAWAADGDEFSAYEYDLSGAYFELPTMHITAASVSTQSKLSVAATARRSGTECGIPGSRLSSTSTFVDESVLSLEQCKRVYVSSMRKLRWQGSGGRRQGIRGMLHIKNTMAKANEQYVMVSNGQCLDAYQVTRDMLSEFYILGSSSRDTYSTNDGSSSGYPARARSMASMRQHQHLMRKLRPAISVEVLGGPAGADGFGSSRIVTAPMSSPPDLTDGAAGIADKAVFQAFGGAHISDSELLGFGAGDLVSLAPAVNAELYIGQQTYYPHRRRRAGRRSASAHFGDLCPEVAPMAISAL
ncbi:hypothetical protein BX661DRAFT_199954 [Kickxella alabastrina]|uniref:uncharacterized protein n=1 Tax=Kickxella alabastrina TaxID=61397 RepID=UPI00222065EB|nr:uncharacterized protein BX661DRAFT_199954 [Kickxella alabastrina]KAI7823991.1 hypothetical protein BX661DRAFT_199954 [Kickxella alabastrina]